MSTLGNVLALNSIVIVDIPLLITFFSLSIQTKAYITVIIMMTMITSNIYIYIYIYRRGQVGVYIYVLIWKPSVDRPLLEYKSKRLIRDKQIWIDLTEMKNIHVQSVCVIAMPTWVFEGHVIEGRSNTTLVTEIPELVLLRVTMSSPSDDLCTRIRIRAFYVEHLVVQFADDVESTPDTTDAQKDQHPFIFIHSDNLYSALHISRGAPMATRLRR